MKFDHIYILTDSLEKSVQFYTKLFDDIPRFKDHQWADWGVKEGGSYFGIMNREGYGDDKVKIEPSTFPVIVLGSNNLKKDMEKVKGLGGEIIVDISSASTDSYEYKYFWFKDLDGYTVEVAKYKFK